MAAIAGSVARRYARALFSIGVDQASVEPLGKQLDELTAVYAGSLELRQAMENPVFKLAEKRSILEKILPRVAPNRLVRSFALLLLERGRIGALPGIARAYRELSDAHAGRVRARITSARPLDVMELAAVQRAIEKRTGKKALVETAVDPELIGGVVAHVGDLVLDGSIRTKLANLKERLVLH